MRKRDLYTLVIGLLSVIQVNYAQGQKDSIKHSTHFYGSLGFTNNGFSIIPSFSFDESASIILLSWRKEKFSVDPEFRLTPTGKKGSILLWFRYHAIQGKRFSLRVGAHPAVNWFPSNITQNGRSEEVIRLRRFLAWELAPSYRIAKSWSTSLYYLQGNGMQQSGPQTTHFVNLNTTVSNIPVSTSLRLTVTPAVYYLYLDGNNGIFFTATASLGFINHPFVLQSTINQEIRSTIPGTKAFMWNVGVAYTFKELLRKY